jgi:hypothetical protein
MSLITWKYERRNRIGPGKQYEQRGDVQGMLTALLRDAELHEAWETAAELREKLRLQLNPQPISTVNTEPVAYTESEKSRRKRKAKSRPTSPELERQRLWAEVRARHER